MCLAIDLPVGILRQILAFSHPIQLIGWANGICCNHFMGVLCDSGYVISITGLDIFTAFID